MKFTLRPGAKIGRKAITGLLPDPRSNGYGTLGCFLVRPGSHQSHNLFILTNGHVVDWRLGQDVYVYEEDNTGMWKSKKVGKVSKVSAESDYANGIDAAAIKVDNSDDSDWIIDFKANGVM